MVKIITLISIITNIAIADPKPIIVYQIDTGLDTTHLEIKEHLPKNIQDQLNYIDLNNHGTHVAGIILKDTCKEVEIQSCSWFKLNPTGSWEEYLSCLRYASSINPKVINISSGGNNYNQDEFELLKNLSDKGIKIVVAAGNDGQDLSKNYNYYPAKYDILNLIPVGNLNANGKRNKTSNYGLKNEVYEIGTFISSTWPNWKYGIMSGTSMSAAQKTNSILKELCKTNENH